mmetsp:Transcript_56908/g.133983  ORF Transcript_56908/g.133983 Transcript_56908/m.133983 type:complete len:331 (-) Transcript_56908:58-1050(-)
MATVPTVQRWCCGLFQGRLWATRSPRRTTAAAAAGSGAAGAAAASRAATAAAGRTGWIWASREARGDGQGGSRTGRCRSRTGCGSTGRRRPGRCCRHARRAPDDAAGCHGSVCWLSFTHVLHASLHGTVSVRLPRVPPGRVPPDASSPQAVWQEPATRWVPAWYDIPPRIHSWNGGRPGSVRLSTQRTVQASTPNGIPAAVHADVPATDAAAATTASRAAPWAAAAAAGTRDGWWGRESRRRAGWAAAGPASPPGHGRLGGCRCLRPGFIHWRICNWRGWCKQLHRILLRRNGRCHGLPPANRPLPLQPKSDDAIAAASVRRLERPAELK